MIRFNASSPIAPSMFATNSEPALQRGIRKPLCTQCDHDRCMEARETAAMPCTACGERIGYDTPYIERPANGRTPSFNCRVFSHTDCGHPMDEDVPPVELRCRAEFFDAHASYQSVRWAKVEGTVEALGTAAVQLRLDNGRLTNMIPRSWVRRVLPEGVTHGRTNGHR